MSLDSASEATEEVIQEPAADSQPPVNLPPQPTVAPPPSLALDPGPWPTDLVRSYTLDFKVPAVQSVGVDDAYNIWLLDRDRIGVLRPGTGAPIWTSGVGQAGKGFRSTVLCGGAAGQAYVGYMDNKPSGPGSGSIDERLRGDADIVKLAGDHVVLDEHMVIVSSNDPRFDETRTLLSCAKVMRGTLRGEVYFGTNHAVTRVRGNRYSDHRHMVFTVPPHRTLQIGYHWAVSITQDGDVFIGNEYKIGLLTPPPQLEAWTDFTVTPWKLDTFVEVLGPEPDRDFWRATAQTTDGRYYIGSLERGLWQVQIQPRRYTKVAVGSEHITALAATDDGSLFIGTSDQGLRRLTADGVGRFEEVAGDRVKQLVYDPTVAPPMLYALTDKGLFVLRGY